MSEKSSPEIAQPDIIEVLRSVHSALDESLGDTDISCIENDDELRDEAPVQWAAQWLAHAIELLEETKRLPAPVQSPLPVFPSSLEKVFEDHYWDTFQEDRELIMKHIRAVIDIAGELREDGLKMEIPEGWKLVPIEPTLAMCTAYERAIKEFINRLPRDIRHRYRYFPKGYRVPETVKIKIRWEAMVKAAPFAAELTSSKSE